MGRKLPVWCKRAKIAMLQSDISVSDLADELNLTRPYVSSVLNGRVNSPAAVKRISDFLQIADAENELQV